MRTLVAPEILQLLAVGADDGDRYLTGGRHLRWLPNPLLGFPRRGFVLRRKPSPDWPWDKRTGMFTTSAMTGEKEGAAVWLRGFGPLTAEEREQEAERGVRASSPGSTVQPEADRGIAVRDRGLMLEFQARAGSPRPNPAAWVALRVAGELKATVSATAWAQGPADKDDAALAEVTEVVGALPAFSPANRDEDRVVLLDGGLIDAVELHADGEVWLKEVWWLPVDRYAAGPDWEEVGRFLLPLDGDGATYPSQPDADDVAKKRVAGSVPKAWPPWDDPAWPPAPADPQDLGAVVEQRHLGRLDGLRRTLERILDGELDEMRPQGEVLLDVGDDDPLLLEGSGDEADLALPGVPLLLAASLEAPLAHLLGLATVDREVDPEVPFDYCVSAVYPSLWLAWLMGPELAEMLSRQFDHPRGEYLKEQMREAVVPPLPPEELDEEATTFLRAVSVATGVTPGPLPDPPSPRQLAVDVRPDPTASPLPARAELSWQAPDQPRFDNLPVVGVTADRTDPKDWVSLARTDPVDGQRLPYLAGSGDQQLVDRDLRAEGPTLWTVRSLDIWGRWGEPAKVDDKVADELPPPSPSGVVGTLRGDVDEDNGVAQAIAVAFDWGGGQAAAAPDLDHFEVTIAAGDLGADEALAQGTAFEVAGDASAVDPDGSARSTPLDDGGARVEVGLPKAPVAADGHRWETTAVVVAVDQAGNRSAPAQGLAELLDAAEPSVPDAPAEVQLASWPDADGLGWWTCRWEAEEGVRVQVLRAAGARLLDAAGEPDRSELDDKTLKKQATYLRGLAVAHPHAFSPDHPRSLAFPEDRHAVSVDGASRDLTVVVAMPTGPTGTRAAWPQDGDAFAVVAARRLETLAPPRLLARAEDGTVSLRVEGTAGATRARVWRTVEPDDTGDLRRMRPLVPKALDAGTAELSDDAVAGGTWYGYRAALESPDGRRSDPSAVVWVRAR